MAIRPYFGGSGSGTGSGFTVGDTYTASTKVGAEALRDADLIGAKLQPYIDNQFRLVQLNYDPNQISYTNYVGGVWHDVTGVVTGPTGTAANLSNLTDGYIPIKGSSDTEFEDSGIKYNSATKTTEFRDEIKVPPGTINYGDMGKQSQNGPQPMFTSKVTGKRYLTSFQEFNASGSADAWVRDMDAETAYVSNADKSTSLDISTNKSFDITTTETEQINEFTFYIPANTEVTNFRLRIKSKDTGKDIFFYPDEFSWVDGDNGVDVSPKLVESGLIVDVYDSPISFIAGQNLTVDIIADSGELLGSSTGIPSLDVKRQVFRRDPLITRSNSPDDFQGAAIVNDHTLRFTQRDGSIIDIPLPEDDDHDTQASFEYFRVKDQPTTVADGTVISGTKVFEFKVHNPSDVVGNLILKQGNSILRTNISPTAISKQLILSNGVTMHVGDTLTYSITGTRTTGSEFSKTFIIKCVADEEMFYYGLSTSTTPHSVSLSGFNKHAVTTGDYTFSVGPTQATQYIMLFTPNDHDIEKLMNLDAGVDVLTKYKEHTGSRVVNGVNYKYYYFGPVNPGFTQNYKATFE